MSNFFKNSNQVKPTKEDFSKVRELWKIQEEKLQDLFEKTKEYALEIEDRINRLNTKKANNPHDQAIHDRLDFYQEERVKTTGMLMKIDGLLSNAQNQLNLLEEHIHKINENLGA